MKKKRWLKRFVPAILFIFELIEKQIFPKIKVERKIYEN